jgi:protein SCO1
VGGGAPGAGIEHEHPATTVRRHCRWTSVVVRLITRKTMKRQRVDVGRRSRPSCWALAAGVLLHVAPFAGRGAVVSTLAVAAACKPRRQLDVIGQIPPFTFTDQSGKPFGAGDMRGEISVAAFMFTRCPTICPRITATMQELQAKAAKDAIPIHWISFSVDPENDTPAVLEAYAKARDIDLGSWSFVTGDSTEVRRVAEEGFKIAAEGKADVNSDHYGISHGSHLVLVDRRGNIRGYYRTLDDDAQSRLLEDARLLIEE